VTLGQPLLNASARVIFGAAAPVLVDSPAGNGLRVDWTVEKVIGPTIDRATITIYNLNAVQRGALAKVAGIPTPPGVPFVSLFTGWQGLTPANLPGPQPELLFTGDSIKFVPNRVSGTDIITIVEAGDGYAALKDTPPSGLTSVGELIDILIPRIVVTELGLAPNPAAFAFISAKAAELQLLPFANFVGSTPRDMLDALLSSLGLMWGVEKGFFVVYDGGLRNDLLPTVLSPDFGLLDWATLDDGGLEFTAVSQARVVPGMQLLFQDELGVPLGPPMRCQSVTFTGSTVGACTMQGVARKVRII